MIDQRATVTIFRPVAACAVFSLQTCGAIGPSSSQDVMLIRSGRIVNARQYAISLLVERRFAV
jgi:hypothetical protein